MLYDRIGQGYDFTRRPDADLLRRIIRLLEPGKDRHYVDVACGTGNYTLALAAKGIQITGFDISPEMIAKAMAKPRPPAFQEWHRADATRTPFANEAFAGAICTLAIHHFPDLSQAFGEVSRILDSRAGRFVIFTSTPGQMKHYWLARYFPEMMQKSRAQMPGLEIVRTALMRAGFQSILAEPYQVSSTLSDMFLYSGKHRPELYLDPAFRAGISSFANLARKTEIAEGLKRLSEDIASGEIGNHISAALHEGGDYLFILARRLG